MQSAAPRSSHAGWREFEQMMPSQPTARESPGRNGPCRLLVSVRDVHEAEIAIRAGVDLVDIKETEAGSLGAASGEVICQILSFVGSRLPLSVALGELLEPAVTDRLPEDASCYVKLGLAGCGSVPDWPLRWQDRIEQLPAGVQPVAVVYADWRVADAPPPSEVLRHAGEMAARAVLVDTFGKIRGNLLAHWSLGQIAEFVDKVHRLELPAVLAGSLSASLTGPLVALGADCLAFRGAVCRGDRSGPIDSDLLLQLVQNIRLATGNLGTSKVALSYSLLRA